MLQIKLLDCGTNLDFDKGYYIDMSMEIYPGSLSKNKLVKVHEYVINEQYEQLFTYLADNVK